MLKILEVPFKKQVLANSCFPAAIKMILRFYNDDIDERKLYKKSTLPGHKGTWDFKIGPIIIRKGYRFTSYWNGPVESCCLEPEIIKAYKAAYKKAIKIGMGHKKNASVYLIKNLIGRGIPVIAEVHAGKFYNEKMEWTHVMVIFGYDRKNFYFHDPDKKYGGANKKISFSKFKKCWEKISPDSGKSMSIIEK